MKKKTKIYFFHPYSGLGGADLSISRLINGLDNNKFEVDFFSINKPKIQQKIKSKIKYRVLKSKRTLFSMNEINRYILNDKKFNKKVFISNQSFANTISSIFLRKAKNLKLVLFERNHIDELKFYKTYIDFFKKKIIKLLIKFFYRRADLIITNSTLSSKFLGKFLNLQVKTLYNPCFFKIYRKKRKKNKKQQIILNVSRFSDQKDHLTLLRGFANAKYNNKFKLYIVGYGEKEKQIKNFILTNKIKNIKIFKNKFLLDSFYKNADLFILTSLYEGFPNVLVEAASYRIPIISSNSNSGSKEILLNGKGGSLFKVKDFNALSKLIDKFYLNKKPFFEKEKICASKLDRFSNKRINYKFNKLLIDLFK